MGILIGTDFNPGVSVCIKNPALDTTGPDGVPDCKVDLYEFAQVAEAWLECGLSPADYCAQ
jgi:radical SAM superfamily enzyme